MVAWIIPVTTENRCESPTWSSVDNHDCPTGQREDNRDCPGGTAENSQGQARSLHDLLGRPRAVPGSFAPLVIASRQGRGRRCVFALFLRLPRPCRGAWLFFHFIQGRRGPIVASDCRSVCVPAGPLVPGYSPWPLRGQYRLGLSTLNDSPHRRRKGQHCLVHSARFHHSLEIPSPKVLHKHQIRSPSKLKVAIE
jgi:hypothetical protein